MSKCEQCEHGRWMPESSNEPWNACDWCENHDCFKEKKAEAEVNFKGDNY